MRPRNSIRLARATPRARRSSRSCSKRSRRSTRTSSCDRPSPTSWRVQDDGRRVVFRLRSDLVFSDGSPLRASDVARSWFRVIDPDTPSPLMTLFADVRGALAYADGEAKAEDVGIHADDSTREVTVDMERAAADFPAIVASPTFAVVPASIDAADALTASRDFVASGGYRLVDEGATEHDAAGEPALLGWSTGDRHHHRHDHAPGREPGRSLPGRRSRLRLDRQRRRALDRLRPHPRPAAARGAGDVHGLLRLRYDQAAVRRRSRAPGVRRGRRLAADRRARRRRSGSGRDVDGAARDPGPVSGPTCCRVTILRRLARSWRKPGIRVATASRGSRS